ncbi:hypothetical protein RSOLAG22IIIB_07195 [Rhizoctonia solani]|uniref:HD domain-containing protein n=1 Tax=Rhizoctonia solani TaxID=456999 RepID=A0A0K6FLW0_9AGAM|nr:hypothetical protein RSOLAG22IIIB_07195 [Rhizoctonia solani]
MVQSLLQREFADSSVERSLNDLLAQLPSNRHPRPISILDIKVPETPWAEAVALWTKDILTPGLYSHSRRGFFYASALLDPELGLFPSEAVANAKQLGLEENMWLAAMLHDVTLVPEVQDNLANQLSFEIQGGILAHEYLSYPQPQTTSSTLHWGTTSNNRATPPTPLPKYQIGEVVESIVVHTDRIMLDALGGGPPSDILRMWHPDTILNGAGQWPRDGISLVEPLMRELETKPGCHITTGARAYPVMELMKNNPYFELK